MFDCFEPLAQHRALVLSEEVVLAVGEEDVELISIANDEHRLQSHKKSI
jgi:hypothetical protein